MRIIGEYYQDQFAEWVPRACFIETGLLPHEMMKHLDPYRSGRLILCRDTELLKERVSKVDKFILKCSRFK